MNKYPTVPMMIALALAATGLGLSPGAALAQSTPSSQVKPKARAPAPRKHAGGLTLEQAVARVQNRTGGKVLKADSRNLGRFTEYRIKVLTPKGHVRVVTLRSDGRDD